MTNNEMLECLTERPCDVCKFHNEKGCTKWECVFDQREQEPKTEWIPTSKRQPEENGNYLAFYRSGDETATLEFMMVDHCNAGGGWLHEKRGKKSYTKVIAWQPLPEPYEESEDKEC